MAVAFNTLGYAQRLREAGIDQRLAEAHAAAARDFVMAELATKTDLALTRESLNQSIAMLEQKIETQTLRLTIRLGGIVTVGVAVLAAILKLT